MAQPVQLGLERLFVKDVSFESPASPGVFGQAWKPKVHLDIATRTNDLGDDRHEVVLTVTVDVKTDAEEAVMIVEIQQAGIFRVQADDAAIRKRVLAIGCPNVLFPYVREAVDSLAVRGGFNPLRLPPVDFEQLYSQAASASGDEPRH